MNTGDVTSTSEKYRVVTPERAKLCFKVRKSEYFNFQLYPLCTWLPSMQACQPTCAW